MSVSYHVTVHTGDVSFAGTIDKTSLSLVGSLRSSEPIRFSTLPSFKRGLSKSVDVTVESDLGDILLVRLFKKKHLLLPEDSWYCSYITVKTANKIYYFPCYSWLNGVDSLDVFEGTARKRHNFNTAILEEYQRKEMQKRQDMYQWHAFAPGIPKSINCANTSDLPRDEVMPFDSEISTFCSTDAVIVELGLHLKMCDEVWSIPSEFQTLCEVNRNPVSEYVKNHWEEDRFFGYQYLNGSNPVLIEQCSEIPAKFPVTDEMVAPILEQGTTLQQEVQNGNIFIVDYVLLDGITANTKPKQQYLEAPMCLFYLKPSNDLVPIAIQIKQEAGPENPIFLPTDSKYDWLLAKIWVRHADTQVHQLVSHLLKTHLFAEVFCIATHRKLPSLHPLFKLLMPHLKYTLHINTEARALLISEGGVFDQAFSTGGTAKLTILQRALANTTYSSLCLPDNVVSRRVDKIPNYYYRDDALKIWHATNNQNPSPASRSVLLTYMRFTKNFDQALSWFVANIIDIYYKSDASVREDEEIHEWATEIFTEGFLANKSSGFPTSFSTKDDLVKYLTMVIFTCSAQHSAVNAGQFDWGSYVPNNPSTMQKPAPTEKGKVTEEDILNTLPMKSASVVVLATIHQLSQPSHSETRLGTYMEQRFIELRAEECIKKFQEALIEIENEIEKRNQGLELKYTYLMPSVIENSVVI